jgi:hypothetical protein
MRQEFLKGVDDEPFRCASVIVFKASVIYFLVALIKFLSKISCINSNLRTVHFHSFDLILTNQSL